MQCLRRSNRLRDHSQSVSRNHNIDEPDVHIQLLRFTTYMGLLLFEPYAKLVAERCAIFKPDRILETAAGTGIVTREVHQAAPRAQIVALVFGSPFRSEIERRDHRLLTDNTQNAGSGVFVDCRQSGSQKKPSAR